MTVAGKVELDRLSLTYDRNRPHARRLISFIFSEIQAIQRFIVPCFAHIGISLRHSSTCSNRR